MAAKYCNDCVYAPQQEVTQQILQGRIGIWIWVIDIWTKAIHQGLNIASQVCGVLQLVMASQARYPLPHPALSPCGGDWNGHISASNEDRASMSGSCKSSLKALLGFYNFFIMLNGWWIHSNLFKSLQDPWTYFVTQMWKCFNGHMSYNFGVFLSLFHPVVLHFNLLPPPPTHKSHPKPHPYTQPATQGSLPLS